MGFNARLVPYSTTFGPFDPFIVDITGTDEANVFQFPVAGQIISGSFSFTDTIAADTTTGVNRISFWKFATDDATATFATGLVAVGMTDGITGAVATARPAFERFAMTSGSSAAQQFNAGDSVMLHQALRSGASVVSRKMYTQFEYILGRDTGTTPTAATGPVED